MGRHRNQTRDVCDAGELTEDLADIPPGASRTRQGYTCGSELRHILQTSIASIQLGLVRGGAPVVAT